MKTTKMLRTVCILILAALLMAGCRGSSPNGGRSVTDALGRQVTVPETVERVVCIGAGALRLYSYVGDLDKLAGVEACERGFLISARPYQEIHEERFLSLPNVGTGGPQGSADAEAILAVSPDVVFSTYTSDLSAMDELERKLGIPVVVLSYGETEAFDGAILRSLALIGEVAGCLPRAQAVCDYILALERDLEERTGNIPEEQKPSVYLGCQSNYGTHGIGSSTANYSLFDAVHAKNVLDVAGFVGYQKSVDLETLLTLDPQVIILDAGGLGLLQEDYRQKKDVLDQITAFREGELYLQMPYNAYYTNLEIAFANAYFIGKVLYPEAFSDVDPGQKLDEISTFLLGEGCYEGLAQRFHGGYGKLDLSLLTQ